LPSDPYRRYHNKVAFQIPEHLIIKTTDHWIVNHRVDSKLPGYLMISSRHPATQLCDHPPAALAQLGPLLAAAQRTLLEILQADHVYLGRYGHQSGHSIHFHAIPVYSWVKAAFAADPRYAVLKTFYTPGADNTEFDGAELTLFIWREFCEKPIPPVLQGPSVSDAIHLLKENYTRQELIGLG
jgi:diadenosine tetraphosphate (Ap4A) HIT family hydrolase